MRRAGTSGETIILEEAPADMGKSVADIDWTAATDLGNTQDHALEIGVAYTANTTGGSKPHDLPSLAGVAEDESLYMWVDFDSDNNVKVVCDGADLIAEALGTTTDNRFVIVSHGPTRITKHKGNWIIINGTPI